MADSIGATLLVQYLDILAPALISLIPGLVIHSLIIGVNVNDWWKGRSVTSIDHIVTALGISRMCSQCTVTLFFFVATFFRRGLDSYVTLTVIDALHSFFIYSNIWLTTLLSIVYCLKISNLRTRLFLFLGRMIVHRTVHLIAASAIFSALNWLLPFWVALTMVKYGGTYNTTMANPVRSCSYMNSLYNIIFGGSIPLLFYYVSSILLFSSLYHHTVKMKTRNNVSINLETYYSVMKFVSFTFIYNTVYWICNCIVVFYYYFYCISLLWLYIIIDFLPALHSSYLIYRTAKLQNTFWIVINFLFQKKDIRENIELVD